MPEARQDLPHGCIDVTLLGRFAVALRGGNRTMSFSREAERLVAYLLLRPGRRERREDLIGVLWGHAADPPADAFEDACADLRRRLDAAIRAPLVRSTPDGDVELDPSIPLECDLEAFERGVERAEAEAATRSRGPTEQAIATERLYHGHLLESWTDGWILARREEILRRYLDLLEILLRGYAAAGEHARVVLYATRALAADPLHETAHRALIAALDALGDPSGALNQYERLADNLRRLAGRQPEAASRALAERIRDSLRAGSPRKGSFD